MKEHVLLRRGELMYKEVKTMKKLGKKLETTMDTLEAYTSCNCMCDASVCYSTYHSTAMTVTMGISNENSGSTTQH